MLVQVTHKTRVSGKFVPAGEILGDETPIDDRRAILMAGKGKIVTEATKDEAPEQEPEVDALEDAFDPVTEPEEAPKAPAKKRGRPKRS